ncbi:MAG: DUF4296 domain-containing protein [Flavobacteriales bacterium]|jgi:hypothetical protein|nr:DUF4296 domain-containing protein [Flavobacteriales bacterium]
MLRHLFKIAFIFTLAACTSNTIYEKPKDLIPKEQMIDLLTDLYIANAAGNNSNKEGNSSVKYFPLVYEKYKIDSNRFKSSNFYYTSKVKDYQFISEAVYNNLEALKKEHENLIKIQDSTAKVKKDALKKTAIEKRKLEQKPLPKPLKTSLQKKTK